MKLNFFGLALLFGLITGCASIMSGPTQQITFQSTPEGATVIIDGKPLGKTPLTLQLDKKDNQILSIEKEGHKTFTTTMNTGLDPWFWGNIVLGGVFGSTTDGASGSINEYSQGEYIISLEAESVSGFGAEKLNLEQKKVFLFVNYIHIKRDLGVNSGEYLTATLEILDVKESERSKAIVDLKTMIFSLESPADFVKQTLTKYLHS